MPAKPMPAQPLRVKLSPKQLEPLVKAFASRRRLQALLLAAHSPDVTFHGLARKLRMPAPTASYHIRMLAIAGLLEKKRRGRKVLHRISPLGRRVLMMAAKLR